MLPAAALASEHAKGASSIALTALMEEKVRLLAQMWGFCSFKWGLLVWGLVCLFSSLTIFLKNLV